MISATRVPCHRLRRFSWFVYACLGLVTLMAGTPTAEAQPYVYALNDVSDSLNQKLNVINAATNTSVAQIVLGEAHPRSWPEHIAMAPDGGRIYVINNHDRTVSVVSTRTSWPDYFRNTVEDTWPSSLVGLNPTGLAVSSDSRRLYVTSLEPSVDSQFTGLGGALIVIDVASRARLATIRFGLERTEAGVVASPDGSRLYIPTQRRDIDTQRDKLTVLNTTTFGVIAEITLSDNAETEAVSLSPDGRFAYLSRPAWAPPGSGGSSHLPGIVDIVDTTTNTVVATMSTVGETPVSVAVSPNGAAVYVASRVSPGLGGVLHRLDPSTHALAGTIGFVSSPLAVAFLPDSSRAYVAAGGKTIVLDTATNTVLATLNVDSWAFVTTPPGLNPPATPAAPTLTASVSGTTAHLSWTPAAGPSALSYVLEAGTAPSLSNAFNNNVGNTTQLSAAAPPGTYYVRVRGVNASGIGAPSKEVTLTIGGVGGGAPGQPTITSAVASGGTLNVAWSPSAGASATSHRLDFFSGGSLVASVNAGATTSVAMPIPPGTQGTFDVRVTAVNGAVAGPSSLPRTFTIGAGCSRPASPTLSGAIVNGTASVNWPAVPGATSYVLSAGSTPGGTQYMAPTSLGTNTGAIASGLPAGFTAWVQVFAVNACGVSAPTDLLVQ